MLLNCTNTKSEILKKKYIITLLGKCYQNSKFQQKMESEQDQLKLQMEKQQANSIISFPYAIQSPKIQPFMGNLQEADGIQIPQSVKYIHERYPLNQIFDVQQSQIDHFIKNNKSFHGIKYLFGLENIENIEERDQNGFLEDIDTQIFNTSFFDNPNLVDLNKLFQSQDFPSQQSQHKALLDDLTKKLSQIQNKAFTGISIHKTVGTAFSEHYQNFLCLREASKFFQNFQLSFQKFFNESKNIKKCGPNLILMIYEFWMRMFRQFIRQIWRHSEKYSLDMFKKHKSTEVKSQYRSNPSSTSSSQQGQKSDKQKRKQWSKNQIDILEKIINSNAIFNNARLKQLSNELGRTTSSISSKIQKIVKIKKSTMDKEFHQDISIEKKVQQILKMYPLGLSKEEVIKKLGQMHEMGLQQNWKKSVSQILSSRKTIQKIKGSYRLIEPQYYYGHSFNETLKDKIIKCFLKSEENYADLKTITLKYLQQYYQDQEIDMQDIDKLKSIELNISKALNRYDKVFAREGEKILYRFKFERYQLEQCMDVEPYVD